MYLLLYIILSEKFQIKNRKKKCINSSGHANHMSFSTAAATIDYDLEHNQMICSAQINKLIALFKM